MPNQKNFGKMSLDELVDMRSQIGRAIEAKVAAERAELQMRLDALNGYKAEGGSPAVRSNGNGHGRPAKPPRRGNALKGRKVAVKYRGPDGETWSGRGLAPRWLSALEAKGKKRDSYLV